MQFVGLGESNLSGVLARLPQNDHDIDTEWEIDPTLLRMQEKLGMGIPLLALQSYLLQPVSATRGSGQ